MFVRTVCATGDPDRIGPTPEGLARVGGGGAVGGVGGGRGVGGLN